MLPAPGHGLWPRGKGWEGRTARPRVAGRFSKHAFAGVFAAATRHA